MKTTQVNKNKKKKTKKAEAECATCGQHHNSKLTCLQAWLRSTSSSRNEQSEMDLADTPTA